MAMMTILEDLVKDGMLRWTLSHRSSFDEDFDEMRQPSLGMTSWIPELSAVANVVVGRCSRILDLSMDELQHNFDTEASDYIKQPSTYARNFLEYCCFRALALYSQVKGHLADPKFHRLTFDMMLAWESPASSSQPVLKMSEENTIGVEAFSRIAPAVPTIADVITCSNLFDVLTMPLRDRLSYAVYEKYLGGLYSVIKKMTTQSESSLLWGLRSHRGERILDVDGTLTTQPVLEHVGVSAWPGRLTLTDHALYFEELRVIKYDKAKVYDLADDLGQIIRPELTGPWGSHLFDKGVMYKSISLSEPVIMEFPELTGHSRRDYWLAILQEILCVHKFIRKFHIEGVEREEILSKALLGIMRLQAIQELAPSVPVQCKALLMFNLSDQLPAGDLILETLADMTISRGLDRTNKSSSSKSSSILSRLGLLSQVSNDERIFVGEIVVGEMASLERVVRESRNSHKLVEQAQATIDGVKVDGIDTNLAVMKELLYPVTELGKNLIFLASWEDPLSSLLFCSTSCFIIYRGWLSHLLAAILLFIALFMLLTRCCNQGRPIHEVKVRGPREINTMEQLLAVQNAISQVEELVQDGNIILLKLRALLLAVPSKATTRAILVLVLFAITLAILPSKLIILVVFLELFTRNSPPRRASTERIMRRLKEWWYSIPAAPFSLGRAREEKKRRHCTDGLLCSPVEGLSLPASTAASSTALNPCKHQGTKWIFVSTLHERLASLATKGLLSAANSIPLNLCR